MDIRQREPNLSPKPNKSNLKRDESTYYFSSTVKEKKFIKAQFQDALSLERYNIYRKEWHRRANEMDPGLFPLAVICELVSFCNLKCEMCYTRTREFQDSVVGKQRLLPWDTVTKIIDECSKLGVFSMLFSWRGESTLYRSKGSDGKWHDFADVLGYARKKGILEVTSLTNGRSLTDKLIKKIVYTQPNWISFSVDGVNSNYNMIRRKTKGEKKNPFNTVIKNIKQIIKLRDSLGFSRPQVRTNTIYPPIAKDSQRYRIFMEKLGVGLVTVNEILDFRADKLPEDSMMKDWFCQYPFQRLVISANGIIMPCPGAHNEDEELILGIYPGVQKNKKFPKAIDKVFKYKAITIEQAWNSKEMKQIRFLHAANRRQEILACKYCRHGALKHGVKWIPEDWDMEKMEWSGQGWRE